jgi:hypothetical protein
MREQHDVDALGVDAGGLEVLQSAATPLPVSISTSLEPVLMSCGLNGTVTMPFGM